MRNVIAEESFTYGAQRFYVGYKQAKNGSHYLTLARMDKRIEDKWISFHIFQEHIENVIQAIHSVFRTAAYRSENRSRQNNLFLPDPGVQGIKSWDEAVRPREKLMEQGREAMSDAELLAMLICAGLPGITAVDLAEKVLALAGNDLKRLAALSPEDLMTIRGIGHARALSVISAMELAVRLAARDQPLHFLKLVSL